MRALFRDRRRARRVAVRSLAALAVAALTATLAGALQVRDVRVSGARRFPVRDAEDVLRRALGTPTVAARASALRATVCALPWVADATVRISLDGVVSCTLVERVPVAVEVDGTTRLWLDAEGRALGAATPAPALLELDGYAAHPEERAALLAAAGTLERCWGETLERAQRVGPEGVALRFARTPFPVLADPGEPQALAAAHRVVDAWVASGRPAPLRVDARAGGRVALAPAPPADEEGE